MRCHAFRWSALYIFALFAPGVTSAVDRHVWASSPAPGAGYLSWTNAAHTIQEAVDAASDGDVIWVTNGVYGAGGRAVTGDLTNRVAIDKAIAVCSVGGPAVTVIEGSPDPAAPARCAYVANGARLVGFTLTNGCTRGSGTPEETDGGGAWCQTDATLTRCVIVGNLAWGCGGGVHNGSLFNCLIAGNTADGDGGGANYGSLVNCTLAANYAGGLGGGAYVCQVSNCVVWGNSAYGGGPNCAAGTVDCSCASPLPPGDGNIEQDPLFVGAATADYRLQAESPCIGAGRNQAWMSDAGDLDGRRRVLYSNVDMGAYEYELPPQPEIFVSPDGNDGWTGTSCEEPKRTLQAGVDACADGGTVWAASGVYSEGGRPAHDRATNRVAITRALAVRSANGPDATLIVGSGYRTGAERCAYVAGGALLEGFTLTNGCCTPWRPDDPEVSNGAGAWCETGGTLSNCVVTRCWSDYSGGGTYGGTLIGCTLTHNFASQGGGACTGTLYGCTLRSNTGTMGGGAALSALVGCTLTENDGGGSDGGGAYRSSLTNCLLEANRAYLRGGGAAMSTLVDCTLTGNWLQDPTMGEGGGAWESTLDRCTLVGNDAQGGYGGGAEACALRGCTLVGNAASTGGGATASTLYNCLLTGNYAGTGGGTHGGSLLSCTLALNTAGMAGGAARGALTNCVVWGNEAASLPETSNYWDVVSFDHCCTAPLPTGDGNVAADPLFVNAGTGNLRLKDQSPCIGAGINADGMTTDLDGQPRITGSDVDLGAYEWQGQNAGRFIAWLKAHGLATDGTDDDTDTDGDGRSARDEFEADTDPTDPASRLAFTDVTAQPAAVWLTWSGGVQATQILERAETLAPGETVWEPVSIQAPPVPASGNYLDAPPGTHALYRLRASRGNDEQPAGSIGDRVWYDNDFDGVQDASEAGLATWKISLLNESGALLRVTQADDNGYFRFRNVAPGRYRLRFEPSLPYVFSPQGIGDPELDSDADPATGLTPLITLEPGQDILSVDAGLRLPPS